MQKNLEEALRLVADIRHWYWHLRSLRNHNAYRKPTIYRHIRACKYQLIELGADPLELHHFCLSLTAKGISDETRRDRWEQQIKRVEKLGLFAVTKDIKPMLANAPQFRQGSARKPQRSEALKGRAPNG